MMPKKTGCALACVAVFAFAVPEVSAVSLDSGYATLGFDGAGNVSSLSEDGSGRGLLAAARPMVALRDRNGRTTAPVRASVGTERLSYVFPGGNELELSVEAFYGGWTFSVTKAALGDAGVLELARLAPICTKYRGAYVNGLSDDESAVVLRAYDVETRMRVSELEVWLEMDAAENLVGRRFGLAAGARGRIPTMLRGMTVDAGLPHSDCGGAWALGAERTRSSFYMVRDPRADTMEDWIDCAKLCGCTTLHLDWWWQRSEGEGHYPVATNRFPRGLSDLRDASLKAHAAGLKTDTHTLSGCIGFKDSWVTPHASPHLMRKYRYTLSKSIGSADTVIFVNEKPKDDHDYSVGYNNNGNVLRLGTELVQYTGISYDPPYAFTGCTRGAFGTEVFSHKVGIPVDYIWQHYMAFFADPDSPLIDEMAGVFGKIYAKGGFDQVYFDGAEGVANATNPPDERKRDLSLRKFFGGLAANGNAPLWEDSTWTTHGWWFHSRIGSWDTHNWAPRTSVDRHIRHLVRQSRLENFLEPSLGWWPLKWGVDGTKTYGSSCYHFDEQEYFAAKMAGCDSAFSVTPWGGDPALVNDTPFTISEREHMTIIGRYERFRLARAFAPGVRERLAEPGRDFRLRQDGNGLWQLTPVAVERKMVRTSDDRVWTTSLPLAQRANVRVEALYGVGDFERAHETAISAADVRGMTPMSAPGVTFALSADAASNGIRLKAANANASSRGAWAAAKVVFSHPYTNRSYRGFGAYGVNVKGDGSGAILNIQTGGGRANGGGLNEHYVKLDFTGWRYFAFPLVREHDAAAFDRHVWPYAPHAAANPVYERAFVVPGRIGELALWLNEVPAGGKTDVVVGEVRALPCLTNVLTKASVTIGQTRIGVPFALESGEFADLEDGFWTKRDVRGDVVCRAPAQDLPLIAAGEHAVCFEGVEKAGRFARAEVTVFAAGDPFAALAPVLTPSQEEMIAFEPELPFVWAPAKGLDFQPVVRTRPGHRAVFSFEIVGPISRPRLSFGDETRAFDVAVAANEKLVFRDGDWFVRGARGRVRVRGKADAFLPFTGSRIVRISSDAPETAFAQVRLFKSNLID